MKFVSRKHGPFDELKYKIKATLRIIRDTNELTQHHIITIHKHQLKQMNDRRAKTCLVN